MTTSHAPVARAGTGLRLLRAAVFAALCVALAAGGHVLASGAGVPLWTLLAAAAAVFAAAASVAGRERSLPGIAAALAGGQLLLHGLFGAGQHGAPARSSGVMDLARQLVCRDGGPLSEGQARQVVAASGVSPERLAAAGDQGHAGLMDSMAGHSAAAHASLFSLPMLLGHLLAALAAGWLLRRGESALWRLVRLAAHAGADAAPLRAAVRFAALLHAGLPGRPEPLSAVAPADRDETPAPRLVLQHAVSRRGPPVCALAA
jgi:hypothetical protein